VRPDSLSAPVQHLHRLCLIKTMKPTETITWVPHIKRRLIAPRFCGDLEPLAKTRLIAVPPTHISSTDHSPVNCNPVWSMIASQNGGLLRSDSGTCNHGLSSSYLLVLLCHRSVCALVDIWPQEDRIRSCTKAGYPCNVHQIAPCSIA
jgi:hypothetical protein